jgi:hypothetical protein
LTVIGGRSVHGGRQRPAGPHSLCKQQPVAQVKSTMTALYGAGANGRWPPIYQFMARRENFGCDNHIAILVGPR